jgi:hypothetical protein
VAAPCFLDFANLVQRAILPVQDFSGQRSVFLLNIAVKRGLNLAKYSRQKGLEYGITKLFAVVSFSLFRPAIARYPHRANKKSIYEHE